MSPLSSSSTFLSLSASFDLRIALTFSCFALRYVDAPGAAAAASARRGVTKAAAPSANDSASKDERKRLDNRFMTTSGCMDGASGHRRPGRERFVGIDE